MFFAEHPIRIELEFVTEPLGKYQLDGQDTELTADWLRSRYSLFGPSGANESPPVCRIDTAAGLSVIPRRIWEPYALTDIQWLSHHDNLRQIVGVGGSTVPTRLGRVETWLIDLKNRKRLVQWIVAECALDGQNGVPELPHALFGLGGNALKDAGICINHADLQFWFVRSC